jgi:hypothetical protein
MNCALTALILSFANYTSIKVLKKEQRKWTIAQRGKTGTVV